MLIVLLSPGHVFARETTLMWYGMVWYGYCCIRLQKLRLCLKSINKSENYPYLGEIEDEYMK